MKSLPEPNREKQIQHMLAGYHDALDKIGITEKLLARKLKQELSAKETKAFKATTGDRESGFDTEIIYSKPLVAWDIRQKARMSAEKILGIQGLDKIEHGGQVSLVPLLTDADRQALTTIADQVVDAILREHRSHIASSQERA